jgi:hypothetical protein
MSEEIPEQSIEELMANSSLPANIVIQLKGFEQEYGTQLGELMGGHLKLLGGLLDLSALDGVTVAWDYKQALLDLDRGFETPNALAPTSEFGQGIAMTPVVMREDVPKSHIVLDATVFSAFLDQEHPEWHTLHYMLAHECGHVHDRHALNTAFPGFLIKGEGVTNELEKYLYQLSDGCWTEYAASRLSAPFGKAQAGPLEETFFGVLEDLNKRTEDLEDAYAQDKDWHKFFRGLSSEYERIMRFASYLLGHLKGGDDAEGMAPKFKELMESDHWIVDYIKELDETFDKLWERYGKWEHISEISEIGELIRLMVGIHHVYVQATDDNQMYVSVMHR